MNFQNELRLEIQNNFIRFLFRLDLIRQLLIFQKEEDVSGIDWFEILKATEIYLKTVSVLDHNQVKVFRVSVPLPPTHSATEATCIYEFELVKFALIE